MGSSQGRLFGADTIYGRDGEHAEPYMTRAWVGRLRLHVFWRGDLDPDHHDHPWDFWTFPLTDYVEEYVEETGGWFSYEHGRTIGQGRSVRTRVVRAFRLHRRPAEFTHRAIGRYDEEATRAAALGAFVVGERHPGLQTDGRPIITLVWRGGFRRDWGFLKLRDGRWCWTAWRDYVFGDGKDAPCS